MRLSMDNLDGRGCECHLNCQVENFTDKFHAYSVSIQNARSRYHCSVASGFADWTRPNHAGERDRGEYSDERSRWHAGAAGSGWAGARRRQSRQKFAPVVQ
jgi:hypothetical protein